MSDYTLLGPCPPEPPPEPFIKGEYSLVWDSESIGDAAGAWVGIPGHRLTPDEAEAMAGALVEHARYVRKQEGES